MKATRSLKTVFLFALASLVFLAAPGCKKEEEAPKPKTLCELIEGEWEVTSYRINGSEWINSGTIERVDIEFEEGDCEGDFTWTITYSDGPVVFAGEYSIDEEEAEIALEFEGGASAVIFDIEIDDDEIEISGINDGVTEVIEAERK